MAEAAATTTAAAPEAAAPAVEPAAAEDKPKVAIVSSDGETFMVPRDVVFMSATLRNMLEDLGEEGSDMPIPLPNVKADALRKVIEFCEYHAANPDETSRFVKGGRVDNFREFDRKYSDELREDKNLWLLFSVILAANYLDVKPLVDVTCRTVASMIKGKTPEQICDIFRLFPVSSYHGASQSPSFVVHVLCL